MFKGITRITGYAIMGIVSVAVLVVVAIVVFDGVERVTSPFRDEGGSGQNDGGDPDSAARNVDLRQLCQAVREAEGTISALEQELAGDPGPSRVNQINASLTALRATRTQSIDEYNALARVEPRAAVADAGLPAELAPETMETQCAA